MIRCLAKVCIRIHWLAPCSVSYSYSLACPPVQCHIRIRWLAPCSVSYSYSLACTLFSVMSDILSPGKTALPVSHVNRPVCHETISPTPVLSPPQLLHTHFSQLHSLSLFAPSPLSLYRSLPSFPPSLSPFPSPLPTSPCLSQGLAGSSAIITATMKCLLKFFNLSASVSQ